MVTATVFAARAAASLLALLAGTALAQSSFGLPGDDYGDAPATATLLTIGEALPGVLADERDIDVFRLDLVGDTDVMIRASGPTDTNGELVDHAGARLAYDRDSGPRSNFRISAQLTPGIYYVAVTGNPGAYAIEASVGSDADHGGTPETSTRLPLRSATTLAAAEPPMLLATAGRIESPDDVDVFRIDAPRDAMTIGIRTSPDALAVRGRLLDGDGNEVASADDGGALRLDIEANNGIYYLEIQGPRRGDYLVLAQGDGGAKPLPEADDHGNTPGTSSLLAVGPPTPGTIGSASDVDVFRLDVLGRAELDIRTTGSTDTTGEILAADGRLLATDEDSGPGSNFRINSVLSPGIYYVAVTGRAGAYAIDAKVAGASDHGGTLESATLVPLLSADDLAAVRPSALLASSGRIQETDDVDVFRIVVADNDTRVSIRTAPASFNTNGRLMNPVGVEIAIDNGAGGLRMAEILDAGIYYIEITSPGRGGYRLLVSGAAADTDGDGVVDSQDAFPTDPLLQAPLRGLSTTNDGQIIVQLADPGPSNLFDLDRRSILLTPDGAGAYAREVTGLVWEHDIGEPVGDNTWIRLSAFPFDIGGVAQEHFHICQTGVLTFGDPSQEIARSYDHHSPMAGFVGHFSDGPPAIVPFFKPARQGTLHVQQLNDRVVVTWAVRSHEFGEYGGRPKPDNFQAVLFPDGSIRFSYRETSSKDGIVGVFAQSGVVKQNRVLTIADPIDADLPAYIDILKVDIYETNTGAFLVEFEVRGPLRRVPAGSVDAYGVLLDIDEPFWTFPDWPDSDVEWYAYREHGSTRIRGPGNPRLVSERGNRIVFTAYPGDFDGGAVTFFVQAVRFDAGFGKAWDHLPTTHTELRVKSADDFSRGTLEQAGTAHETFHWPPPPDTNDVSCQVIEVLGDVFDVVAFHTEFRVDTQTPQVSYNRYSHDWEASGIGPYSSPAHDCSSGRLAGRFHNVIWLKSEWFFRRVPRTLGTWVGSASPSRYRARQFDVGSWVFVHELAHTWGVQLSFINAAGAKEPLYIYPANAHWRPDLHTSAAFPWDPGQPYPPSVVGGHYWRENADGTYTHDTNHTGSFSWLDLYAMGLAHPSEVADTFLLRNLPERLVPGERYAADPETVSIGQVIAAEGVRLPAYPQSRSRFNAGLVYLPVPGQAPDPHLLALHAEYIEHIKERWHVSTGQRSTLTTEW